MILQLKKHITRLLWIMGGILAMISISIPPVMAQTPTPPLTPTVTSTPTPVPDSAPVRLLLTAQSTPNPMIGGETARVDFTLSAIQEAGATCYGIPRDPLDLFFVVDNSGSAGNGSGSNLALTRRWLDSFITLAEQQTPAGTPPQRSRIGLAASRVGAGGTEILWQTLSEDYAALRAALEGLPGGGDTELAAGIRQVTTALQQRARPNARQVLVLMLHDRLPLTEATFSAVTEARQAGIEVYLFANSLNLSSEQVIDASLAQPIAEGDYFLSDPSVEDLRYIFVRMTGGSVNALAQNVALTILTTPDGFRRPQLTPSGLVVTDTISWLVPQLTARENAELACQGDVGPLSARDGQMTLNALMTYQDCNGASRTQEAALVLRAQEPVATVTPPPPSPTPSPITRATDDAVTSTPRPDVPGPVNPTPTSRSGVSPLPEIEIPLPDLPEVDLRGPIDQFLIWLVGLLPNLATAFAPLIGALPVILQWLLIILLIALLLFLLWRLFKMLKRLWGRKKPEPTVPPLQPVSLPPQPSSPSIPQWIPALSHNYILPDTGVTRVVPTATPHPLQDTLLIGLGPAGREVLTQIAAGLSDRFGVNRPEQIHLLQVDVLPADMPNHLRLPSGLQDEQWVVLRPDFKEVAETLRADPQAFAHWKWYEVTADEGRGRGRMALFNDVKSGGGNSVLWQALTRALQGLKSPVIRIIGTTFDDVSSGMLVDVARLTQLAATGDTNGNVDVQLWLSAPVGRDWSERLSGRGRIRADEQLPRTLVTLRELERFQRNAPVMFRYVPDTNRQDLFRAARQYALINKIILFEPMVEPSIAPEDDTFACMTDTLLALLNQEPNSIWNAHLDGTRSTMGTLANNEGRGAVLALGSHALRYPGAALARALAWRLVREALFETALGLFPMERLDYVRGSYEHLPENEQGQPLKSLPMPRPEAVEKLVYDYKGNLETPAFAAAVRTRVNALLNGEAGSGEPLVARRAGLAQTIRWLKLLRDMLLQNDATGAARRVHALEKDLDAWQRWLKEQVYPLCKQGFDVAHAELEQLRAQPVRNWGIDTALEWELYRNHIRPWTSTPSGNAQAEPFLRLSARFGWEVQSIDGGWHPRLIVPPGEFAEVVEPRTLELLRPYELALPVALAETLLHGVYALAARVVQMDTQTSVLHTALSQDFPDWLKRAALRVEVNETLAVERMRQVDHLTLLVAPESADQTPQLARRIQAVPDIPGRFELCQTNDPTSITLVRATSWLPLSTLALYDEAAWASNPAPAALYVWRPEQIAADLERDRPLSALLVSRIAENEPLLQAFGWAYLHAAVTREARGWRIPGMIETVPGTLWAALEAVFAGDVRAQNERLSVLLTAVEERSRDVDRRAYLKQVEQERIKPLEHADARTQDLAVYLRGLIHSEIR